MSSLLSRHHNSTVLWKYGGPYKRYRRKKSTSRFNRCSASPHLSPSSQHSLANSNHLSATHFSLAEHDPPPVLNAFAILRLFFLIMSSPIVQEFLPAVVILSSLLPSVVHRYLLSLLVTTTTYFIHGKIYRLIFPQASAR